jgi:exodeoxyribonuclease VII small subunit
MSEQGIECEVSRETSFEEAFAALEVVVEQLEEGALSLEASIALYEKGQRLAQFCQERLDEADLRVEQIQSALHADKDDERGGLPC